jgi:hypothetical protein
VRFVRRHRNKILVVMMLGGLAAMTFGFLRRIGMI